MDRPGRPATAAELQAQFANSDKVVLWGIIGFGVVLMVSISAVGILITHKVAGPLYKIASFFGRIRDNKLGPTPAKLRKGDELQGFYLSFREMHQALRGRTEEEVRVLGNALAALEAAPGPPGAARARGSAPAAPAQGRQPRSAGRQRPDDQRRLVGSRSSGGGRSARGGRR